MPEKKLTYTEAFEELQEIVKKLENADISVDDLTQNVERASFLLKICQEVLRKTEVEVNKIIEEN